MKELLLACDRCGSKLDEATDYADILIALNHKWKRADLCKKCFVDLWDMTDAYLHGIDNCNNFISATDVAGIKHAKWEICCDGYYPYCSSCKREPQGREMTDYCPNCGAKMDCKE